MSGVEILDVLAWISLIVAFVTAIWWPNCGERLANKAAVSAVFFAVVSALFLLAYPNNRRVVAMSMIVGAVVSELVSFLITYRRIDVMIVLAKVFAALIGSFLGALLLHVV